MTQKDTSENISENISSENFQQEVENLENTPKNALSEENQLLKEKLSRAQADYQNLLMRNERDRKEMHFYLMEKILRGLLPQIDHLERAMKIAEGVKDDAFVDGVRSVVQGLEKYLASHGVESFESVGKEVDPDRHEVLSQMPGEEGKILQEFEKGYILNDRVLRHAKVVVGSGE